MLVETFSEYPSDTYVQLSGTVRNADFQLPELEFRLETMVVYVRSSVSAVEHSELRTVTKTSSVRCMVTASIHKTEALVYHRSYRRAMSDPFNTATICKCPVTLNFDRGIILGYNTKRNET